jgi:hypothetical protein
VSQLWQADFSKGEKKMKNKWLLQIISVCSLYILGSVSWSFGAEFVWSTQEDLNGDGSIEDITLSPNTEPGTFVLKVDECSAEGKFENILEDADGFIIVDIDETDIYKEVAVHTPGPSSDDEYLIFWYDGKAIKEMGYLSRWPVFYGNGIVNVDAWMGFWSIREKYVLDKKSRTLQQVPQEFYYVGVEAEVIETFPIYKTRSASHVVANLKPKSVCLILVCDPSPVEYGDDWYLIKYTTGLVGWTQEKTMYDNLILPWAD